MSITISLVTAFVLSWFNLDIILIDAINELLKTNFSTSLFWIIAIIIGIIGSLMELRHHKKN